MADAGVELTQAIGDALSEIWPKDDDGRFCDETSDGIHRFDSYAFGLLVKEKLDEAGLIVSWFKEPA